jgi:hypothetical protein
MIRTDAASLAKHYATLSDAEILNLKKEGGFTEEAARVLEQELLRRNLHEKAVKRHDAISERDLLREEAREKGFSGKGPGLLLFGSGYLSEKDRKANIQLRTKFFSLGGLPLIPIASYRFQCSGQGSRWSRWFPTSADQRVVSRVPLNWSQVGLIWLKTAIFIACVTLVAIVWFHSHRK